MKRILLLACVASMLGCVKPSHVLHLAAEDCVEIAKANQDGTVEVICATIDELAPLLDLIAAKRRMERDAGVDGD